MTSGLRIKEVAEASGFSAATLRYYEQIGLLPAASRTPAGYRTYDRRTLDRLGFIARAKQLGCSLEEITGLSAAWDGGQCGPLQDQLRELVAGKLTAAQHQIAELVTFSGELLEAASALAGHRPDGACDADCGCISDPPAAAPGSMVQAVSLSIKPAPAEAPAIACTVAAGAMTTRLNEWNALLAHVERREHLDGGVRAVFASSVPIAELIGLLTAEQDCCEFFRFAITVDTRGVALEVRAPHDVQPIVASIFGTAA